jgi:pyruvate-formate lyase-activating enzyme
MTVGEVTEQVERPSSIAPGGGMTISGGEVIFNPTSLRLCYRKPNGCINTVAETMQCTWANLEKAFPHVDTMLHDIADEFGTP